MELGTNVRKRSHFVHKDAGNLAETRAGETQEDTPRSSTVPLPDPHMVQLHTKNTTALAQGTLKTNGSSPGWVIIFGLCNPNTLLLDQEQTQASNRRHYPACSGKETGTCRRNRTDVLSGCTEQVRLHTCRTSGNTNNSIGFQAIIHITQRCRQLYHI